MLFPPLILHCGSRTCFLQVSSRPLPRVWLVRYEQSAQAGKRATRNEVDTLKSSSSPLHHAFCAGRSVFLLLDMLGPSWYVHITKKPLQTALSLFFLGEIRRLESSHLPCIDAHLSRARVYSFHPAVHALQRGRHEERFTHSVQRKLGINPCSSCGCCW